MRTSVLISVIFVVICFLLSRHPHFFTTKTNRPIKNSFSEQKQRSIASVSTSSEKIKPSTGNTPNLTRELPNRNQLEEVIRDDDYCQLLQFQKKAWLGDDHPYLAGEHTPDEMAEKIYFELSPFRDQYEDYQSAISGNRADTRLGQLYENLTLSGLISGVRSLPYPRQLEKARSGFRSLSASDPGNAAPLIFELVASEDLPIKELEPLITEIMASDRLDTYQLDFLKDLHESDEATITGFIYRTQFSSQMAIPDWMRVKSELKKRFSNRPELLEKIGSLLTQQGLNSRKPSWAGGFDPLEYSIGRALLKPRMNLPNYIELDKTSKFERPKIDYDFLGEITANCTPERADKVRQYLLKLLTSGFIYSGF